MKKTARAGTQDSKGWYTGQQGLVHRTERAGTQDSEGAGTKDSEGLVHRTARAGTQDRGLRYISLTFIS